MIRRITLNFRYSILPFAHPYNANEVNGANGNSHATKEPFAFADGMGHGLMSATGSEVRSTSVYSEGVHFSLPPSLWLCFTFFVPPNTY